MPSTYLHPHPRWGLLGAMDRVSRVVAMLTRYHADKATIERWQTAYDSLAVYLLRHYFRNGVVR
jgi:hypothetical protein